MAYVPEATASPCMEKRGVCRLPRKMCSPPRFPEGPRHRGLRTQRGLTSGPPPASRSTGAHSVAAIAQPLLLTRTQVQHLRRPGRHFRRAPQGGGPPVPAPRQTLAVPTNPRARSQATSHRLRCRVCADWTGSVVRWVSCEWTPRGSRAPQVDAPAGAGSSRSRLPPRSRVLRGS